MRGHAAFRAVLRLDSAVEEGRRAGIGRLGGLLLVLQIVLHAVLHVEGKEATC